MKKTFSKLYTTIKLSPFFGRTFVVLTFFLLLVKQILLFSTHGQTFLGSPSSQKLAHYLGFFVSDFVVFLIILGLVFTNTLIKKTFFKLTNNIFIFGIFLLFVLDIFTMYFFQSRISMFDMQQFITPSLGDFSGMIVSGILIVLLLIGMSFFVVQKKTFKKNQNTLLAISFLLFGMGCVGVSSYAPLGLYSLPKNILSLNISAIRDSFFASNSTTIPDIYQKFFHLQLGQKKQANIIVVFAESLSAIDSLRVGGVNDNLPYFDKIQKEGITFTNFIHNGCTSDTAHIGLLLGVDPIKTLGYSVGAYSGFRHFTNSLPNFFTTIGYNSTFISSVDLNFLGQKEFLSSIGFGNIIGKEQFSGQKTYVFDAAPDHVLYKKTLEYIQTQTGPYFIALQNISFHKPYHTPYGKTESHALRYADKTLYSFYIQLKQSGFFDNGILVIVSDHRKMENEQPGEKEALGDFWYTRGVATIVGTGILPGTIHDNIIQHTDFFYSIKQLVGRGMIQVSKIFNNTFSSTKKRDRAIVYCRYFQKNNKYTLVQSDNKGTIFNALSEISHSHRFVYTYLSSYLSFQQGSGTSQTPNNSVTFIAHQGSPLEAPENSLEGFQLAKKNGAHGIELDVSYTKDKHNLVIHGERMRATSCGKDYIVGNHTLEKLKTHCPLKNGEELKTLEEVLKSLDGLFDYYFVDIKVYNQNTTEQQVKDVIQTVQNLGMQDRVILSSYDKKANYILGSHNNIIAAWDTFDSNDIYSLHHVRHQYFMLPYTSITGNLIQEVEDIGKKFVTYTVNTTGELQQLYNQGVRMVMTDNVPLLKEWAEEHLGK